MPPEPTVAPPVVAPPETVIPPVSLPLGNTLEDYLIAFGIFAGVIVILWGLKFLALRLKKAAKKTKTDIDDFLIEIAGKVSVLFFAAIGAYAGARSLALPSTADKALQYFIIVVVAWELAKVASGAITYAVRRLVMREKGGGKDASGTAILHVVGGAGKGIVWAIAILIVLSNFGVNVTALFAGLGVTTLAIGLALQPLLRDFFSGVVIYVEKPFQAGDFIVFDGSMGVVERIGFKTTRLRAPQGEELIVPNSKLTDTKIQNFGSMEKRKVEFTIGVKYSTSSEKIRKIRDLMTGIIGRFEELEFDRCDFVEFGDAGLKVKISYWVTNPDFNAYMEIRHQVNLAIKEEFEIAGIVFDRA